MKIIGLLCVVAAFACSKKADKAPDPAAEVTAKADDKVGSAVAKVTDAVGKVTSTVTATKAALTAEVYEKLVLGLESCKLVGYDIDGKCPAKLALDEALKDSKTNLQDIFGMNGKLGEKLLTNASPAVRVKAAQMMASFTGTAAASQDAVVEAAKKETDPGVLQAFIRTVSNDGAKNPKVSAMLLEVANHADTGVRLQAIYALSSSWNREMAGAADKLAAMAEKDLEPKVRAAACEYGGKHGAPVMLPVLDKLTAKADDAELYRACMTGIGYMFHQYPFYETTSEGAYRLFLKRLAATPRSETQPPWGVMSLFRYAGDPKNEKLAAWKAKATWFKPADVKKALAAVIADKKTNWMARTAAIDSFAALGATKAELEALKQGYDGKDSMDANVVKAIDDAEAKAP